MVGDTSPGVLEVLEVLGLPSSSLPYACAAFLSTAPLPDFHTDPHHPEKCVRDKRQALQISQAPELPEAHLMPTRTAEPVRVTLEGCLPFPHTRAGRFA